MSSVTFAYKRPRVDPESSYFAGIGMDIDAAISAGMSMTSVLRKRPNDDAGAGPLGQFVRRFDTFGVPRSLQYCDSKLRFKQLFTTELRWSRLSKYTVDASSTITLPNGPSSERALSGKTTYDYGAPTKAGGHPQGVYAWDLTTRNSNATVHAMCRRLRYNEPAAPGIPYYSWENVQTFGPAGTTASLQAVPYVSKTSLDTSNKMLQCGKSVLKDVEIRLLLQGSRQCKTSYYGYLVQFDDDIYSPHANITAVDNPVGSSTFWSKFVRQNHSNPVVTAPTDYTDTGRWKIMKRWAWHIAPDSTTNADASPPILYETLKIHLNRICNWDYEPEQYAVPFGEGENENNQDNPNACVVITNNQAEHNQAFLRDLKARVYFVLKAYNGVQYSTDEFGGTTGDKFGDGPQFDCHMRMLHVNQPIVFT